MNSVIIGVGAGILITYGIIHHSESFLAVGIGLIVICAAVLLSP